MRCGWGSIRSPGKSGSSKTSSWGTASGSLKATSVPRYPRQTFDRARAAAERSGAGARGCRLRAGRAAQATALADAEALQTILENLFEDLVLHGASQVEVSVVREAARLLIHVRDSSDGFGPARRG